MAKTLLLADDSVVIQKLIGLSFANEDIEIVTADNGDDAITRARAMRPDAVIADVIMPGKSGYEVCEAIKQDAHLGRTPVLLLTGTFEAFDEERARAVGADGHITKPFEAQALVQRVRELLDRPSTAPTTAPATAAGVATSAAAPAPSPAGDESFEFFDDDVSDLSRVADVSDPSAPAAGPAAATSAPPASSFARNEPEPAAADFASAHTDRTVAFMPEDDFDAPPVSSGAPARPFESPAAAPLDPGETVLADDAFQPATGVSETSDWATEAAPAAPANDPFAAPDDSLPSFDSFPPAGSDPGATVLAEDLFGDASLSSPDISPLVEDDALADLDFEPNSPLDAAGDSLDLLDSDDSLLEVPPTEATGVPVPRSILDPGDSMHDISSSDLEPFAGTAANAGPAPAWTASEASNGAPDEATSAPASWTPSETSAPPDTSDASLTGEHTDPLPRIDPFPAPAATVPTAAPAQPVGSYSSAHAPADSVPSFADWGATAQSTSSDAPPPPPSVEPKPEPAPMASTPEPSSFPEPMHEADPVGASPAVDAQAASSGNPLGAAAAAFASGSFGVSGYGAGSLDPVAEGPAETSADPVQAAPESFSTPAEPVAPIVEAISTPAEPVASPAESFSMPAEPVASPAESFSMPAEPVASPAESFSMPAEPVASPAESFSMPAEPVASPAESFSTPAEPVTSPADSFTAPADSFPTAARPFSAPGDSFSTPAEPIAPIAEAIAAPEPAPAVIDEPAVEAPRYTASDFADSPMPAPGSPVSPPSSTEGERAASEVSEEPIDSGVDVTAMLRERLHDTMEKVAWEAFSELSEQVVREVLQRVETIAWEVIPQMTEAMIKEEIRRMKGEGESSD